MVLSAMTHSTGSPVPWNTLSLISFAAAFAMFIV